MRGGAASPSPSLFLSVSSLSVVNREIEATSLKAAGWSALVQLTPSACWENLLTAAQQRREEDGESKEE